MQQRDVLNDNVATRERTASRRRVRASLAVIASIPLGLLAASVGYGQDAVTGEGAAMTGPGWTGLTHPDDIIMARQLLMAELAALIAPLDLYSVGGEGDLPAMQAAADSISSLLLITPHLFPPTTDVYEDEDASAPTVALPAIWEDFDTFYDLAAETSDLAFEISMINDPEEFRIGAGQLRMTCDACHASFMQEYTLEIPQGGDVDIDFDSLFQ